MAQDKDGAYSEYGEGTYHLGQKRFVFEHFRPPSWTDNLVNWLFRRPSFLDFTISREALPVNKVTLEFAQERVEKGQKAGSCGRYH